MNLDFRREETANAQTQRLAALGFMLAGVCHEISNPLAAVHSMLQILQSKRGVTPETMERGIASISANIARVLDITRKLGDFSRVGNEPPSPTSVDAAMEQAVSLLKQTPHGALVQVEYRGSPEVRVLARQGNLQQVLSNILLNAAQAMRGAGLIRAQARATGDGRLALSIRDSGAGIPEECLQHLFEPFFTTKPPGEGIGLGLAICDEIVRELGGEIRAFNHPLGGACFELTLPLETTS
jgi:C4-dicarboxylate-specific signal transduction histidine kinase